MAVKIRLTRIGKKNDPKYRIVALESSKKRDGKYIEQIGFYDPMTDPQLLKIDKEKINKWLRQGAQLSDGMIKLLKNKKEYRTQQF